jgi:hypothetical protein
MARRCHTKCSVRSKAWLGAKDGVLEPQATRRVADVTDGLETPTA